MAARDALIRRLDGSANVVHRYSSAAITWGLYITNIMGQCGYAISTSATLLMDDGRDSVIGNSLYLGPQRGYFSNCSSNERAMFSEYQSHSGWNECGIGNLSSASGVTGNDAISYPAGASKLTSDVTGMAESYAVFVR